MSREQIAEVLKRYRNLRGMSVPYVCEWLASKGHDVKQKTLYSYESGHRQPDADVLMRLCELYNIEDVLQAFGYGDERCAGGKDAVCLDSNQRRLLAICESLNNEGIDKIIEYASDLSASGKYIKEGENERAM